jgi:nucleotide-binding universal stress UspA family protein
MNGSRVLVGFDGSPESMRALRWAADEARLRRLPLVVCHAWDWPYPEPTMRDTLRKLGQQILDDGIVIARRAAPSITVSGRLVAGSAREVLVNQSQNAALMVIGAQGNTASIDQALGSAAVQLPAYAHCPVLVVRETAQGRGRPIVVGVDGSAASEAALGFAFEEAALRGRSLRALYGCWEPEAITASETCDPAELRQMAAGRLERTVSPWREKYSYVAAETSLVACPPRQMLLDAAEEAELLVVGGRGLGGLETFRLGAVSTAVLHHAPCSVAIVRPRG